MAKHHAFAMLLLMTAACPNLVAAEPVEKQPLVREIFVPEADIDALLEGQPERMLLSRNEYETLLKKAKKTPEKHAPRKAVVVAADYQATVEQGRARLVGTLDLEVLEDGLWTVPLALSGAGIRRASLDGRAAPLARSGADQLTLFVEGIGRHQLVIEMVAPMATTAARQRLTVRLPDAPASRLRLTAPGDVEIKSGADVAQRVVDQQAGVTRFELPTASGALDLNLSLNSRLLRRDRVVVARSVVVDEITQAYERLHATVSLAVLHRAVERFEFGLPDGFEITDVATPQLARWAVSSRDGKRILEVHLREPATDSLLLTLSALRTDTDLSQWKLPRFVPLDVMAESAVVGLLLDQRLIAQTVGAEGLIPIDTSVLRRAIPETVFQAAPGAPPVRPITAWYAPQGEFDVTASFVKPPAELAVTTNLLLILEDQRQRMQGGFLLTPEAEPIFDFEMDIPAAWHVTSVTGPDGQTLTHERYGNLSEASRVKVKLPRGVEPGQGYRVYFEAESVPSGWLGQWETQSVEFPKFAVRGAGRDLGAIAVDARDDMIAQPEPNGAQRLSILGKDDKAKYLAGVVTDLAYRYESPEYRLPLMMTRTTPRLTAGTFSFLRVEPDAFVAHYELAYDVEEARTRRLSLLLPKDTPETIAIQGLDGVQLKEYVSTDKGGKRRWDVLLAEPRSGRIRLAVDFHQPRTVEAQKGLELPIVLADGVTWQTGHVAVEGDAELEVIVHADPQARRVDVGELVDAEYQPGRRLLGVYGFADQPGVVAVDVIRREGHNLFPAIVHRASLASRLSAQGLCQTVADFRLMAKVSMVEVALPPSSELWSGTVDGKPIKPQKEGARWLINLPATSEGQTIGLQLVYEMPVGATGFRGQIDMPAPELRFRGEGGVTGELIPIADFQWNLHPPSGCTVLDSSGTVMWQPDRPTPAVWTLARGFGGVLFGSPLLFASRAASSHKNWQPTVQGPEWAADSAYEEMDGYGRPAEADFEAFRELSQMEEDDEEETAESEAARPAAETPQQAPPPPSAPAVRQEPAVAIDVAGVSLGERLGPQRRGFKSANALQIELQSGPADQDPVVTFTSLGSSPRLAVTLADAPGISKLSWGVGLLVFFVGLLLTAATPRRKLLYVLTIICLGSLIPLLDSVFPFLPDMTVALVPANVAVYAAGLLLPYYLLVGFGRWLVRTALCLAMGRSSAVATALLIALGVVCVPSTALAQPPEVRPYVVEIVDSLPPVAIPDNAVVIPYDATRRFGVVEADRILVPYAKYVELWDRAYPDAKKTVVPPPASYAPAGVSYQTTLVDDGDLLVEGRMEIDVFVEERTEIPLGLDGGVFTRAELDGKPARLSVPTPVVPTANAAPAKQTAQQTEQQVPAIESKPIVLVHVEGKGRHVLEFTVRMRLQRRGGWRTVRSRVPTAPVAAIEFRVPQAQTEVLLQDVEDRLAQKTEKAGEAIRTALGPDGTLSVQWRPSVAEGVVDHSLTAESNAMLDVQEDGVRLAWGLQLEFRRSQHEQFSVRVPKEYLVERIDGTNVRGWEVENGAADNKVTITLLKAAEGREEFTLHLWLGQAMVGADPTQFTTPTVRVDGAALHQGRITVRRSPILDLRVEGVSGASRTDVLDDADDKELASEESPWGIRSFQAYRFGNANFEIRLSAQPVKARMSANVQSVLRITEYERSLECRVRYASVNRKMYRAEVLLPEGFELQDVSAPGDFEWSVTDREGRPKLAVLLASGQQGSVTLVFEGRLPREDASQDVTIPNVQILGVPFSSGQMAVQVDPAYDVAAGDLDGCRTSLRSLVTNWVSKEQQHVTAVALSLVRPDYSGLLRLTQRQPDVHCETITNICVTDRALEETIILDYRIEHAGVREVSFLLPSWMADAKIRVPMLRQKTVEPENDEEDSPIRVRLELQDEVMGGLQVLVENDRTLETGSDLRAAIPKVLKGERFDAFSVRQSVALEKAERERASLDNISFDEGASVGLERLNRRQLQWAQLKSVLGDRVIEAFEVKGNAEEPQLVFRARRFEARETTDARIGAAEARFVLDGSGAYRAEQLFWIDNKTEQYLEIDIPRGAELWTAQLWSFVAWAAHENGEPAAGEPLKPTKAPATAGQRRVRIPLVKTEEGDLDYVIRLQYSGTIGKIGTFTRFDLPFIQPIGMKVDHSQVRLFVPETHRFDFDDTMTLVQDEWDLRADRSAYATKKLEKFNDVLREGNPYAKARALNSVAVLNESQTRYDDYGANERFQSELRRNQAVSKEVQIAAGEVEQSLQETVTFDNRDRLREQVDEQTNYFAKNVVQGLESNFKADRAAARGTMASSSADSGSFNALWLDDNRLSNEPEVVAGKKAEKPSSAVELKAKGRVARGRESALGRDKADSAKLANPGVSQKKMPAQADGKDKDEAQKRLVGGRGLPKDEKGLEAINRYRARHMQQQQAVAGSIANMDQPADAFGIEPGRRGGVGGMGGGGMRGEGGAQFGNQMGQANQPLPQIALGTAQVSAGQAPQQSLPAGTAAPLPAGLASLDVDIPFRGREYRFTTPQGDVRVTGRAYAEDTIRGAAQMIAVLLLAAGALYVIYLAARGRFDWWLGRTGSSCLITLGLLAFLCLPVIGLLAMVGGVMIKVNRAATR